MLDMACISHGKKHEVVKRIYVFPPKSHILSVCTCKQSNQILAKLIEFEPVCLDLYALGAAGGLAAAAAAAAVVGIQ